MLIAGFTTAYDRSSNKAYERALHAEERSSLYQPIDADGNVGTSYDSLDRLRQYQRGTLSSAGGIDAAGGGSITTPITLPKSNTTRSYNLDGLGNWKQTAYGLVDGGGTPTINTETRAHNYLNQITTDRLAITGGSTTATPFAYDHGNNAGDTNPAIALRGNGNLVDDGIRTYVYDALNRLVQVGVSGGATLANYYYDALGRRVRKDIADLGGGLGGLTGDIPAGTTDYLYDGQQIIEDRNPFGGGGSTDTAITQYVWGRYIDELIQMRTVSGPVDQYLLSDLLYRAVALTDSSGIITEAYDTDAYGNTLCFSVAGGSGWWADDATPTNNPMNPYIFTGRQYDPETQIYHFRTRPYIPQWGRFGTRDWIDFGGGMNLQEAMGGNPTNRVDPNGTESADPTIRALQLKLADLESRKNYAHIMDGPGGANEDWLWEQVLKTKEDLAVEMQMKEEGEIALAQSDCVGPPVEKNGKVCGYSVMLLTGSCCADPDVVLGGVKGYEDYMTCWWSCEKDIHGSICGTLLTGAEAGAGVGAVPSVRLGKSVADLEHAFGPIQEATGDIYTSVGRTVGRSIGGRAAGWGKVLGRSAISKGAKGSVVVFAYVEAGISWYCASQCW